MVFFSTVTTVSFMLCAFCHNKYTLSKKKKREPKTFIEQSAII